ncbi:MAG: heparan-alpha-glucosaminide N-acetyltransferase domain-containing protein, partial [Chlorobiota bacterium]
MTRFDLAASMQKSERLVALDAVRFVAMLLMIQGHTLDALVAPTELDVTKFPWSVWNFLRGLTAPVFLLASGIVHVFATKRDPRGQLPRQLVWRRIRWALTLLGVGYLMMLPAQRLWHLNCVPAEQWTAFFRVHILQLLGVTLLAVLALFLFTRTHRQLALAGGIVGLLIVLAAPAAAWVDWYRVLPEPLAAYMSTDR